MSGLRASLSVLLSTCVMLLLITTKAEGQTCQPQWLPGDGVAGVAGDNEAGVAGTVYAVTAWDPDGPGPLQELLVVGGNFKIAGGVVANNIACWDPVSSTWSSLGSGTNGIVYALTSSMDGKLYAGGVFTAAGGVTAKCIACWDPAMSTWSPLGPGIRQGGVVRALAVLNGQLYAGGQLTGAGLVNAKNIVCWDPSSSTWSALATGVDGSNAMVYALAALNGKLYAGGTFSSVDGMSIRTVASWDPVAGSWAGTSYEVGGACYALTVLDGKLFVGGTVTLNLGGVIDAGGLASWDPATSTWSALGAMISGGYNHCIYALAALDGKLYLGGDFDSAGGVTARYIACWDAATSAWSAVGSGMTYKVSAMSVLGGRLYAGGSFHASGTVAANRIACWDPTMSTWSGLGPGMGGEALDYPRYVSVSALAQVGNKVYVGGSFTTAGGILVKRIACEELATSTWSAVGSGVGATLYPKVLALAALDNKLYEGGSFGMAGLTAAFNVACWDPVTSTWSALGLGLTGGSSVSVNALAVLDGRLYAAGSFTTAGGVGANRIACWDPATSTWSALGSGMDGTVYALLAVDGKLYAGGLFTTAGGTAASRIACWDPVTSAWSTLGSGTDSGVFALAVMDGELYAGGSFTTAGGVGANRIACWDPATSTWSAVGTGMSGYTSPHTQCQVSALTIWDGRLYAGGEFTTAGGAAANYIASWDPVTSTWSALGTGMDSKVLALTVLEGTLYAGGEFYTAGGLVSAYMARWRTGPQADLDCDLDVDGDDLDTFEACATGPGVAYDPLPSGCSLTADGQNPIAADFDGDNDVDQADFGVFQRCLSGAGVLAELGCGS